MFEKNKHYSPDLEAAVLGAIMLENTAFSRVFDMLKAEMFYATENQKIFAAIAEMFSQNLPIDLLTVADFLVRKKGIADFSGTGVGYALSSKTNAVVSTANLEYHSLCLKQMWMEREIVGITHGGVDKDLDTLDKLSAVKERLNALTTSSASNDWSDMSQLMIGLYKHQDEMQATGGMGVPSGFKTIDRLYGGFHPGQMIVIAARPSVGKSAFAGQIAINMASKGYKVGIISLEMNNNEIAARLASLDTDIDFSAIFRGLYADERDRQRFYDRVNSSTAELPIYVTDSTDVNVADIKAKAYKLKYKYGLDCLIVDYLQLVGAESNANRNRENEVSKISRAFKIIAKELNVPTIVLAQLNREVDKRSGDARFPRLSDLRESGSIEQDSDVVMFLHSDYKSGFVKDEQGNSTENMAQLIIRKWRNGMANQDIDLDFDGPKMKFSECDYARPSFAPLSKGHNDDNPF